MNEQISLAIHCNTQRLMTLSPRKAAVILVPACGAASAHLAGPPAINVPANQFLLICNYGNLAVVPPIAVSPQFLSNSANNPAASHAFVFQMPSVFAW